MRSHRRRWLFASALLTLLAASCTVFKIETAMVVPPWMIEGAKPAGMDDCADCHERMVNDFKKTAHSRFFVTKTEEKGQGCEWCHGPGSLHADDNEHPCKIRPANATDCFRCHVDKRMEFSLQYHHPLQGGRVKCADCHDVHGPTGKKTSLLGPDEPCLKCHKQHRGPYTYEHGARREGCTVCHNPHGSVVKKMLVADPDILCLRCHVEASFKDADMRFGKRFHVGFSIGAGERCIDCHRAPHGSNFHRKLLHP